MKKFIFCIFFPILIFSQCTSDSDVRAGPLLFGKYYQYITKNEIPAMYNNGVIQILNEKGDLDIPEFAPYMTNDTLFVLDPFPEIGTYLDISDVEDNDLAIIDLRLFIFTKNKNEHLSYKIKKMVLHTSDYVKDVEELGFKWHDRPYARETDSLTFIQNNSEYRSAAIVGGYLRYPRPKDMKISIYLEVEINEDDNITSRSFVYYYTIKLIKAWIRWLI